MQTVLKAEERPSGSRLRDVAGALLLVALTLVFFRGFVARGDIMLSMPGGDGRMEFFGWRYYAGASLREGRVPLWGPLYLSGAPFLAESQTAVFYPLTAMFAVMPVGYAFNWTFILHIMMAGLFMYLFLRYLGCGIAGAVFGAVAFEWSSPLILHIVPGHMSNLITLSWTPLVFLCVEAMVRKRSILMALVLALVAACQLLGGHVQYFYYSMLGAGLFFLFRSCEDAVKGGGVKVWLGHVGRYAVAVGGGLALCAVQLLPTLELVKESIRAVVTDESWGARFSFPPENFLTLIVPGIFGDDLVYKYWGRWFPWEMIAYVGIPTLMMGMVALVVRRDGKTYFFAGLAVVSGVLALGGYLPIFGALRRVLPGFSLFRGHSKFVFLMAMSLGGLSGLGVDTFVREAGNWGRGKARGVLVALAVASVLAVGACIVVGVRHELAGRIWWGVVRWMAQAKMSGVQNASEGTLAGVVAHGYPVFRLGLWRACALVLVTAGIVGWGAAMGLRGQKVGGFAGAMLIAILVADLWSFGGRGVEAVAGDPRPWRMSAAELQRPGRLPVAFPLEGCFFDREMLSLFEEEKRQFRVMELWVPATLLPGYVTAGVETILGVSPVTLGRYQKLYNYSEGYRLVDAAAAIWPRKAGKLFSLLNVRYVITPATWASPDDERYVAGELSMLASVGEITKEMWGRVRPIRTWKLALEEGGLKVFENLEALPRAYIVHSYEVLKDEEEILKRLSSDEFDPSASVVLEEGPKGVEIKSEGGSGERVRVRSYEPERVTLDASLKSPGMLVLGDIFYPGWQVKVDGKEGKIMRANFVCRAVALGEGEHEVVFEFVSRPYLLGRTVSLVVLVGILLGIGVTKAAKGRERR